MKNYVIYNVTDDELKILEREGFEFVEELSYPGATTWTVSFECDKQYLDMALNVIGRE